MAESGDTSAAEKAGARGTSPPGGPRGHVGGPRRQRPQPARSGASTGEGEARSPIRAAISKARSLLDWEPQVSLEEGVARTVAWHREHRELARSVDLGDV